MKVILVQEDNFDAFDSMIPEEYLEGKVLVLGCIDGKIAVGVTVVQFAQEVFNIAYLYVESDRRKEGIGNMLLEGVLAVKEQRFPNVPVACMYPSDHMYADIFNHMLMMHGFEIETERKAVYMIRRVNIEFSPLMRKYSAVKPVSGLVKLETISAKMRNKLIADMKKLNKQIDLEVDDFIEADEQLSVCLMEKDTCTAVMLVNNDEDGDYTISYIYLRPGNTEKGIGFFKAALRNLATTTKNLETITISCIDTKMEKVIKTLFGEYLENYVYYINQAYLVR